MARYESELYDGYYVDHDHEHTNEQIDDNIPIFNEGDDDKITEDMSIYYEKVFEQNEGESLVNKIKNLFNQVKENLKEFPTRLWANIKSIPSRVVFGDNKGFGYKMAKDDLKVDEKVKNIKSDKKETKEAENTKDIKTKSNINNEEVNVFNKTGELIPNMSAFMNEKIHNKEYISKDDIDTLNDLFMKDLANGTKNIIEKIEKQTKDLDTFSFKLKNAVDLADSKTIEEMNGTERRLVNSIPTLNNRFYEIKQNIDKNLNSLNQTIQNYNDVVDKLNKFDSDKLPNECTGRFANGDIRVIEFNLPYISEDDVIIDNDSYSNFKDNLHKVELDKDVIEYLDSFPDVDMDENIEDKENEQTNEVKPSEELESFVTEEAHILNEENDIEIDDDDKYETIEEALSGQQMEEPEIYSVTPETYEDFER